MIRVPMICSILAVVAGCGPIPTGDRQQGDAAATPLRLPACFRLTYAEWGLPPHADGQSMPGARAPIAVQLLAEPAQHRRWAELDTARHRAIWIQEPRDTFSWDGEWALVGRDSLTIDFPFQRGLFGMSGVFARRRDDLVGEIGTYSDVRGSRQGRSRMIGLAVPCAYPPLAPDPFAEDSIDIAERAADSAFAATERARARSGR